MTWAQCEKCRLNKKPGAKGYVECDHESELDMTGDGEYCKHFEPVEDFMVATRKVQCPWCGESCIGYEVGYVLMAYGESASNVKPYCLVCGYSPNVSAVNIPLANRVLKERMEFPTKDIQEKLEDLEEFTDWE